MFQTAGYPTHPAYFDHHPPPRTAPAYSARVNYAPREYGYATTSSKGHARRATEGYAYKAQTYAAPQYTEYYATADYTSPAHASTRAKSQRKPDPVSGSHRTGREEARRRESDARKPQEQRSSQRCSTRTYHYRSYGDSSEEDDDFLPRYEADEPHPPPYRSQQSFREPQADRRRHVQEPVYDPKPKESRPRAKSFGASQKMPTKSKEKSSKERSSKEKSSKEKSSRDKSSKDKSSRDKAPKDKSSKDKASAPRRSSTAVRPPPEATAEDARRAGIPAGYSYKNWDPTEEPVLLLGSVFDANSLGKWIYDWTVYTHGPATPISEVAGDLWLLLIQLAGKMKRAEECAPRIRRAAARDLVDDFCASGARLWQRVASLLRACEAFMWEAARRDAACRGDRPSARLTMGPSSGEEFVASIFGRDRQMDVTEQLMTGMRLWSMRFDANCEDILRYPSA